MRTLDDIATDIEATHEGEDVRASAERLLLAGEDVLRVWLTAHEATPTTEEREGFRLLALHRQGAAGDPSFNACRETCRELAYHYNVASGDYAGRDPGASLNMMRHIARHLYLFISGKLQEAELGDFCCSSRAIRAAGA